MADHLRFPARDGRQLAATLFPALHPRGAVVLASAMGVGRRFYAPLAAFLAEGGLSTLTFDYRGIGESREGTRVDRHIALHDWGEQDLAGAFDHLRNHCGPLPLQHLGHSVGGQIFGLLENAPVEAAVFVGSQSGHWRHWRGVRRLGMFALWHVALPVLAAGLGRIPMKALGQGEDLPAGVASEWARWGRARDYVWRYAGPRGGRAFSHWTGQLTAYAVADDGYAPPASVEALAAMYTQAQVTLREIHPAEVGQRRIGHFGAFREALRETVWTRLRETLLGNLSISKR